MPISLLSEPPSAIVSQPTTTSTSGMATIAVERHQTKTEQEEDNEKKMRYPTAMIDTEGISDVMAARLATCLLAHVLFLKSQVPFPVAQLNRVARSAQLDSRTDKKQSSLLTMFDTLSSHLGSTFSSLSTALSSRQNKDSDEITNSPNVALAHLAIVIGPSATSMSAARSRVLLEIDGLMLQSLHSEASSATRVEGTENGKENIHGLISSSLDEDNLACDLAQRLVLSEKTLQPQVETQELLSKNTAEPASESEESEDVSSNESYNDEESEEDSDSEFEDDSDSEDEDEDDPNYNEVELLAAERILSRTLALANSDPDLGMAADIPPTLTHILLRAPRSFTHPAWIPRPNITRDMESALLEFENEYIITAPEVKGDGADGLSDITNTVNSQRDARSASQKNRSSQKKKGLKTDCVRVRCSNSAARVDATKGSTNANVADEDRESDASDEMIWWSWENRLEGFGL